MASTIIGGSIVVGPTPETPVNVGTNILSGDYATLSQLRTYMSLASAEVSDDNELRKILTRSSRSIDRYCRRHFYPRRYGGNDALKYDLPKDNQVLNIGNIDLLEVMGLSSLNGASEIDSSAYWLKSGDDWNMSPYDRIVIDDSSGSLFNSGATNQRAIRVDAIAGYREDYNFAWIDSAASLTSALGTATTLASISGSAGTNANGVFPRFSSGQLWRLGAGSTAEYAYVKDTIDASGVRLIRAVNGTSATVHASATKIYVWQPEHDIEDATIELSAFSYQKAKSPFSNRMSILQLGVIEHPESWPEKTIERLQRYKKDGIYAL